MPRVKSISKRLGHYFHPTSSNGFLPVMRRPESLLYIFLSLIGAYAFYRALIFFPSVQSSILGFSTEITPQKVIELTNKERASQGLSELSYNQELTLAAEAKAQDMIQDQYWAHVAPDGTQPWDFIKKTKYTYRLAGENLARDFVKSSDMIDAWMKSPTHRENIENGKYQDIGVAVVNDNFEGFETTLVVQFFGTPALSKADVIKQGEVKSAVDEPAQVSRPTPDQEEMAQLVVPSPEKRSVGQKIVMSQAQILQLTKLFFIALISIIILTLIYDGLIAQNKKLQRAIGNNTAHILFFATVLVIIIFVKAS